MTLETAPSQELPPGTRLEEFIIERVLGSGGFGITYLARDKRLGRQVVIKENLPAQFCWRDTTSLTVQPRQSGGEDADNFQYSLESFEKEAATLASLDHPGIVKVLRSFEANGTAYFVMPFVEGTTFDEVIREREMQRRPFTEAELTSLLDKVLAALTYLHERGIYHRDIKPDNLLITTQGDPVLIDFGAARQRLSERSLTVIESPGYTPFEQMQSRGKVGPWSDLYALGGTLYKAITGETPAKATDRAFDDPVERLDSRAELQGRYTKKFMSSIDQAMVTQASQRFQDAGDWIKHLETRQIDLPDADAAGAEEVSVTQFAEAPKKNSLRTSLESSSQLQFVRVGLAVGSIAIVLMFYIGTKVRVGSLPLSGETSLPAQGNVWKVVNVDGREYVTGQSLQLFYRFSAHKVDGGQVLFWNPNLIIKGQVGSQELLVNNIKFVMSYPVLYQGGQALFSRLDVCKLIEPVIRPSYIGSSEVFDTIVLDAGHGGNDSGAKSVQGLEKDFALAMVLVVKEALLKRGFKVVLIRDDDTLVSEDSRVALANQTPESIFISIHFNECAEDESGIETFALAPQGSSSSDEGDFSNTARLGNQFDSENIALATAVHAQVVYRFKLVDRGIKRSRSTELTGLNRPGILFKGGFVTNKRECQLIASDQYRKALAEAIGDAVTNYRKALAPKPAGLLSSPKSVLSDEPSEND